MKKTMALLLCCLLLCGGIGYAESDFDVKDYTDDELIDIMRAIYDAETQIGYLYSNDVLLVGTDIPAGPYEFWVEESDIGFSQRMIDDPKDYHCGASELCTIWWSEEAGYYDYDKYESIYYDMYNERIKITLREGQYVWTTMGYGGANYLGIRLKYFPNRRSGLFSN